MSTVHGGQGSIITQGLVLRLDAANPRSYEPPYTSTAWRDISGNGNNGTLTNGPTFSSANGGSIMFDGVNDYVSCGRQSHLENSNKFTLQSWMKRKTNTSKIMVAQVASLSTDVSFELWSDNNVYFEVGNGGNTYGFTTLVGTNWQFLSLVYDGTQPNNSTRLKGFNNDTQLTLQYNGTIPSSTGTINANLVIGGYLFTNTYGDGNIANLQIYNRALSATEVLQNFNATRARFGI